MNRQHLLYVENISPSSSEEHLITYLEKWAPVQQVYFLREKQCTKRSIAAFVRVANEADLDLLLLRNQQNFRGKRLFMVRGDQTQFFQADHTVIVRNITTKISEENLFDHFADCGNIAFLQIRTDDFAYIGFEDKSSVRNAMSKNNLPLKGSNLKIQLLTRNIEIMIVNLDTLQARMPDLYRKMILPIVPRQSGVGQQQQSQPERQQQTGNQQQQNSQPAKQQQQSKPPQQQQFQPARQQQPGNQQQNSQPAKQKQQYQPPKQQQQRQPQQQTGNQQQQNLRQQQPQQNRQPQQQPLPQRQQQQPQPQRQQMSTIQLLKEKANAFAGKQQPQQQPQQKSPQQAPVVQLDKPAPVVQEQPTQQEAVIPVPDPVTTPAPVAEPATSVPDDSDDVQIIEPMETTEILDDESDSEIQIVDTSMVPPVPSAYKPQPNDLMRPIKASEIPMNAIEVKTPRDDRCVWVNNIQPETLRLTLVMYMEQFGDVETCKMVSSNNCYFTRWAKVCFVSEEAAKKATEYFLHPFQGHYLFVLACNRYIIEVPGKVFVLDYLSKYLVYEDVVKSFKHVGDVFYLVRLLDNSYKVRIFFLDTVDANAALAVKSIGGIPINVEPYEEAMNLKLWKETVPQLKLEREGMDAAKEARMAKILEIYKQESFNRCDPVDNPDGKCEGNVVLISNVPKSTTNQQIHEFLQSVGQPIFIHREHEPHNDGCQRIYVGFRTLSMVLKATELPPDMTLNDCKPFIFAAWTKPHMAEHNAIRLLFASKEITVQDIYNGLIHFGKIRYIEKEGPKKALIVWDGHDNGMLNCNIHKGFFVGPVLCLGKETYEFEDSLKNAPWFNEECHRLRELAKEAGRLAQRKNTPENRERFRLAKAAKAHEFHRMKKIAKRNVDKFNEYDGIDEYVRMLQQALNEAHGKPTEKEPYSKVAPNQPEESIVIDDEDEVVEVSNNSPAKDVQPANQNKKQANEKKKPNQKNPQNRQQQQQQQQKHHELPRGPPNHPQRAGRDRNRNPFADNRSPQGHHPYQQQHQQHQQQQQQHDQRRSMNAWGGQNNQGPFWNDQQEQQQFQRQHNQFMLDDRFDRNNDGPFDMFDQGGRNMNQFDQMMSQQFGNFSINPQNDNGFNYGPMNSDDPPLERHWGRPQHQQQQQQHFNRFSPPRQRSPFGRGFDDDLHEDSLNFGRDSPGIPPNIPEDEIDEYIMRKQEAIKRRLEQLDKQLITSVESSRHHDFEQDRRSRRKGTVFSDNGDVHYVPNPAAVARNRERRGVGFRGGRGRGKGDGKGRRDRGEEVRRQRDPFAGVDIVPIIRISEERSPSPKRNRDDAFDTAQFDAAWS